MQDTNGSRSRGDAGSTILMALFVLVILSLLGCVLLTVSSMESSVAYNVLWSEGAFNAAEAGVHRGLDQISATPATAILAVPITTIGGSYNFRTGRRTDPLPQPLQFVREQTQSGYSIESGTGYNAVGYAFYVYQINATGEGPLNAQREVEVQAEFGPASK